MFWKRILLCFKTKLSLDNALEQLIRLKDDTDFFKESTKPKESVKKEKIALTLKNLIIFLNGRKKVFHYFESRIFPEKKQINK